MILKYYLKLIVWLHLFKGGKMRKIILLILKIYFIKWIIYFY
uniref:Uncharacterized protein n=1 Tax=viral metagenome TaxID=1070528 RepID=A0A6C0ITH8_9ZZZZ